MSIPTTIGNLSSLERLNLQNQKSEDGVTGTLTSLPTTIGNLSALKELYLQQNGTSGELDLTQLTVLTVLRLEYNNFSKLKINLSPTAFGQVNFGGFRLNRNALGCVEVPSDELVSWQLSGWKETSGYIDNGVVFSDNCSAVTNNSVPDAERNALIALYNATNGTNWRNDVSSSYSGVPWVVDATQKRNVGAWFGITTAIINGQKHVTKLELNSNLLDGSVPSEIKDLTQLKELEINSNTIYELPKEIGELSKLEQLTFTGQRNATTSEQVLKSIPTEINNLTNLLRLELNGNAIEGNLDFSSLVNLTSLQVSSNQITGLKIGVPPTNFDGGYDSTNQFHRGFSFSNQFLYCLAVPQSTITDWQNSTYGTHNPNIVWGQDCTAYNNVPTNEVQALVDMYNNLDGANWTNNINWTGDLSKATINSPYNATKWQGITTEIVDGGKHITRIQLSNNKLEGIVPVSVGGLSKLETLNLSSNKLSGSLPTEMSNLTNLKTVYFTSNELSGQLPDFTGATMLNTLYFNNNKFQFGDFEDQFNHYKDNVNSFSYTSQAKVGEEKTEEIGNGASRTIEAIVSGNNNEYQWYKNHSPISGATNKTYQITDATSNDGGVYYCSVKNTVVTGLTIITENVTFTFNSALSIDDEQLAKTIKLYPNPTNGIINLNISSDNLLKKVGVFSVLGKKVMSINSFTQKNINISNLPSGMYMLNIITEKGKVTKRVVKR